MSNIIDADGHVFEEPEEIAKRLPRPYRDHGPIAGNRLYPEIDHFHFHTGKPTVPGSFERSGPEGWLRFLDNTGIETTVLYPSSLLSWARISYIDWSIAICKAYNDWFYERYLAVSPRFKGVAMLPLQDPDASAEELRRCVKQFGMVAGLLPGNGQKTHLGSKEYWPIYREAEALDVAIAIHGSVHSGMGFDTYSVYAPAQAFGHPFSLMISFGGIIFHGILDRFPKLRVGFLEGGPSWLPFTLERFDRAHDTHYWHDPRGETMGPGDNDKASEYCLKHIREGRIFIGCEGSEPTIGYAVKSAGNYPFMYSSDFPHEVNLAMCQHEIKEINEHQELNREDKEAILYKNAKRFYKI